MASQTEVLLSPFLKDERRNSSHYSHGRRSSVLVVGMVSIVGLVALLCSSPLKRAVLGNTMMSTFQQGSLSCTNLADEDNTFCMPKNMTSAGTPPFSDSEMSLMYMYFLSNMNVRGLGGVLASPDKETPGGSYYFHWERDAALVMRTMIVTRDAYPQHRDQIMTNLMAYVDWTDQVQSKRSPNGIDVRGEPKFELPLGAVFDDAWCRPQNDGPGLRAMALMEFANMLWEEGQNETVENLMRNSFWTGNRSLNRGGSIINSLLYVTDHWGEYTCDLWEEVTSKDFFWNRFTMKKALLMGIRFAKRQNSKQMEDTLTEALSLLDRAGWDSHFNKSWKGSLLFLQEDHKQRRADGAVICALNHGWDDDSKQFPPHEWAAAKTVLEYNTIFSKVYDINYQDTANGVGGILYGRYSIDTYAGGNPWILTSAALAQLLYRAGTAIRENGLPEDSTMQTWRQALHFELSSDKDDMAIKFVTAADAILQRIRLHVKDDNFHLYEQISKSNGKQIGARDLTWSYAEVIWAMHARNVFFNVVDKEARLSAESAAKGGRAPWSEKTDI